MNEKEVAYVEDFIKELSEINDNHAPYFSIIIIRRSGEVLEL